MTKNRGLVASTSRTAKAVNVVMLSFALSLGISCAANMGGASVAVAQEGSVQAIASVNVRSGPSTGYTIKGVLRRGETLSQAGSQQGSWTPVTFNGSKAWIHSSYLKSVAGSGQNSANESTAPTTSGSAWTTTALNVRTGPSTSYTRVDRLPKGTKVTLTGNSRGMWQQISLGGKSRWVHGYYLTSKSGSTSATQNSTSTSSSSSWTTTDLNVRTGPSTSYTRVDRLPKGTKVSLTGQTRGAWKQISLNGTSRWVHGYYLTNNAPVSSSTTTTPAIASSTNKTTSTSSSTASESWTTTDLNVRTGPSTNYTRVDRLPKGTEVARTGQTSGRWVQINLNGIRRWVHGYYLTNQEPTTSTSSTTKVVGQAKATVALMLRTDSSSKFRSLGDIPTGTIVDLTGKRENGVAEIAWKGQALWVNANYLQSVDTSAGATSSSIPATVGTRYATAALDIRTSSGSDSRTLSEVPRGTALKITGTQANGRAEIVYNGAVRWVTAQYLSTSKPSAHSHGDYSKGLEGLKPNAKKVVSEVRARYSRINTFYGVRPDPLPDHPSGKAVDIMIPYYRSNNALGWEIAQYLKANARSLGINYIIWDQQIWNIERDREGWRSMSNRGSDTANHKDHLHVKVYG